MSIEAVIFDADGVVIFPWRFARYLEEEQGITPEMVRPFFHGVFNDCLVGERDLKEALAPFLPEWGWQRSVEEFVALWFEVENAADARVIEVVRDLRRSGLTCCLATNQEAYRAEYMTKMMGFEHIFDRLFFSCDLGCQKPSRIYYDRIAKALGLEGRSILFWDDGESNVAAARLCSWNAELYTDFSAFKKGLVTYFG